MAQEPKHDDSVETLLRKILLQLAESAGATPTNTDALAEGSTNLYFTNARARAAFPVSLIIAASDETTDITAGTAKVTFRMPYAMNLTGVRASLTTAQASGSIFTVDINDNGTSILGTKLTIDNNERTSVTAATPATITGASLASDDEITVDVDQIGTAGAKGLKVTLIGTLA